MQVDLGCETRNTMHFDIEVMLLKADLQHLPDLNPVPKLAPDSPVIAILIIR